MFLQYVEIFLMLCKLKIIVPYVISVHNIIISLIFETYSTDIIILKPLCK